VICLRLIASHCQIAQYCYFNFLPSFEITVAENR
jgi:hypothetical protein